MSYQQAILKPIADRGGGSLRRPALIVGLAILAIILATMAAPARASDRSIVDLIVTPDKGDGADGWVRFSDNTKQWVDGNCRTQLKDADTSEEITDWGTIAAIPNGPQLDCTTLLGLGPSDRSIVDLIVTPDKGDGADGWVRFSDNTKQWVDGNCRTQLKDADTSEEITDWGTIAAFPNGPQLDCTTLLALGTSDGATGGGGPDDAAPVFGSGVNFSSGEYACVQGWGVFEHENWIADTELVNQIEDLGAETLRLPLNGHCWRGGFDYIPDHLEGPDYRNRVSSLVQAFTDRGLTVVLDLHWNAPLGMQAGPRDGQQQMADLDHSPAFWTSVATTFRNNPNVAFDLYNEPHTIDWACWRDGCTTDEGWQTAGMQLLVDRVRDTGATQPIILNGLDYGGDLTEWLEHVPNDSADNLVAGFHAYNIIGFFDKTCVDETCWDTQLGSILAAGFPVVIGELGQDVGFNDPHPRTDGTACGTDFVEQVINWSEQNNVPYLGWTYNAHECGGPALLKYTEDGAIAWTTRDLNSVGELLQARLTSD